MMCEKYNDHTHVVYMRVSPTGISTGIVVAITIGVTVGVVLVVVVVVKTKNGDENDQNGKESDQNSDENGQNDDAQKLAGRASPFRTPPRKLGGLRSPRPPQKR